MDPRTIPLDKLNTATKYPSIPTYHALGERGCLTEEVLVDFSNEPEVIYTEKVDGTNAPFIYFPFNDTYIVGSREDLLYYSEDLIKNDSQGIVDRLIVAQGSMVPPAYDAAFWVFYGEVYGHKIGKAAKNYTLTGKTGFRLFDAIVFPPEEYFNSLPDDLSKLSLWRERGGQIYMMEEDLPYIFKETTPRLHAKSPLPTSIEDTYEWLKEILPGNTLVPLDGEGGKPEGVVVRTPDRSKIAKIRFEDYERTLRMRQA